MQTMVLLIMLMNGTTLEFSKVNSTSFKDCDNEFQKLVYSKSITNYKHKKQQATFYKGNEIFMYTCIWIKN